LVKFPSIKPPLLADLATRDLAFLRHVANLAIAHLQVFGHLLDSHPFGYAENLPKKFRMIS